jgi:hypothetical protein
MIRGVFICAVMRSSWALGPWKAFGSEWFDQNGERDVRSGSFYEVLQPSSGEKRVGKRYTGLKSLTRADLTGLKSMHIASNLFRHIG